MSPDEPPGVPAPGLTGAELEAIEAYAAGRAEYSYKDVPQEYYQEHVGALVMECRRLREDLECTRLELQAAYNGQETLWRGIEQREAECERLRAENERSQLQIQGLAEANLDLRARVADRDGALRVGAEQQKRTRSLLALATDRVDEQGHESLEAACRIGDLDGKVGALAEERSELLDLLGEVLAQACGTGDGLDSSALSAYAEGIEMLARHGRVEVVSAMGKRVLARWEEQADA